MANSKSALSSIIERDDSGVAPVMFAGDSSSIGDFAVIDFAGPIPELEHNEDDDIKPKDIIEAGQGGHKESDYINNKYVYAKVVRLCNMLNFARKKLGNIKLKINSGFRTDADIRRINPPNGPGNASSTSDHIFSGKTNSGAVDVISANQNAMTTQKLFNELVKMKYSGAFPANMAPGQILLEKANGYWVHIANSPDDSGTYSGLEPNSRDAKARSAGSKHGVKYSPDNGRTWDQYDPSKSFYPSPRT